MKKTFVVSGVLFAAAVASAVYASVSGYVDDHGMLHEPFFLIPVAYLLALTSLVVLGVGALVRRVSRRRGAAA